MSQEIIFTTLPHQRIDAEGKQWLKLSVFTSIRLTSVKDSTLSAFDDILNWPDKILASTFQFQLANGSMLEGELLKDKIDKDLYKNVFHKDIRVKGFMQEDLSVKRINSFPIQHINDFLIKTYINTAIDSPKQMLTADKFIDQDHLGVISRFQLNESEINRLDTQGQRAPLRTQNLMMRRTDVEQAHKRTLQTANFAPFARQMNPQTDFVQFRNFHKLDREPVRKALPKLKKPEFEFHDIMAVINNYPQLMRKFGFVLDFRIPYSDSIPSTGSIHIVPLTFAMSDATETVSTPPVAYEITKTGFYIADKPDTIFKRGFVKINTDEFSVVQVDADGTALKTNNLAENKVQQVAKFFEDKSKFSILAKTAANLKTVQPVPVPEDESLPYMRSAGIAITKNGMAEHVFARIKANAGFQDSILKTAPVNPAWKIKIPDFSLYSNDVIQGYRMDIAYESEPDKWFSLHQRKDDYTWFDEANTPHPVSGTEPDEGYIELAITEDTDDPADVFVSETLARWEGWSLSVRKPGYAINESDDYELKSGETQKRDFVNTSKAAEMRKYAFNPDLEFKINAQSNIVPGSLPKLRFGKDYRIRIRAVDLAGNSVPLTHQTEDASDTIRKNIRYMRFEPLSSPIVLVGNQLKDGEFLERMVIRSNYDTSSKEYENKYPVNHQVFDEFSQRYLLPPKNSQLMAETHGMFEKAFSGNPAAIQEIYTIIANHEGLYQQNKKDNNPQAVEKVYQPSEVEIIYLPDPMAAGVALFVADGYDSTHTQEFKPRMFGFFTNEELSPSTTNADIPEKWYNAGVIRIRLEEGEIGSKWDSSQRIFTVYLPKGLRTRIKFSTFWRENDFKQLSAIWGMVKDKNPANLAELEELAKAGQHWMLSPSREMELVHALQQPLTEPVIDALIPQREAGDTTAEINTRFTVHGESTEKVEFQAKWTEPLDDGISVSIKQTEGRNTIPEVHVSYVDDTITKGTIPVFLKMELQNNPRIKFQPQAQMQLRTRPEFLAEPQPQSARVNNLYKFQNTSYEKLQTERQAAPKTLVNRLKFEIQESKFEFLKHIELRIDPLVQNFGDTKHRWVDYKLVAASRYREYFDKILKEYKDLNTVRESKWVEKVNILSTARPKAPEIDYIIPTFEWHRAQDADTIRHQRMGGGLRVFLKRPWYSTGDDEMLGIVLPPAPPKTQTIAALVQSYTSLYTHWGQDPLHNSTQPENLSPQPTDFRLNPTVDENVTYPDQPNGKANVVAYPVHFDEERQLWFCDLAINPHNMYFPFVKLALARYQPHSVRKNNTDLCLSPVVLTDMMQLMPDRISVLQFRKEDVNSSFNVMVTGVIYSDISNPYKLSNFIRITVLDSRIGQPIYGVIDDGVNKNKLEQEKVEIEITEKDVQNNRFKVSADFRLPNAYKTAPFQVIIEEFERGPKKMDVPGDYSSRIEQSEQTDKPVYMDVFKINETK